MHLNHKARWVFSPMVYNEKTRLTTPLAAEYAVQWECPMPLNGQALVHCVMNGHQLAAARKDPNLVVLPSLHERAKVHPKVATHYAQHGVKGSMLLHEALIALAAHHPNFEPED